MSNYNHHSADPHIAAPTCADVRDRLAGFVTDMLLGQSPSRAHQIVTDHCATCAACQAELDELRTLLLASNQSHDDQGATLPTPTFNLFFLHKRKQPHVRQGPLWEFDPQGRLIFGFSAALMASRSQPVFAGAQRGQSLYSFDLKLDSPHGLNVSIKIFQGKLINDERLVDVEVNVEMMQASALDQSGSEVVVATDSVYRRETTGRSGLARFRDLPLRELSELRIEVLPRSGTTTESS